MLNARLIHSVEDYCWRMSYLYSFMYIIVLPPYFLRKMIEDVTMILGRDVLDRRF